MNRRSPGPWATLCLGALLGLAVLTPTFARADSLDERFRTALAELDAGRPAQAAAGFRGLVALGVEDPDVYTNLGVAEAEAMRYGHAMVAFERALALRPGDSVAERGLENAATMLERRRAERHGEAITVEDRRPLASLGRALPEPVSASGTMIAVWLAALAAIALAFVEQESRRIGLGVVIATAALLGTVFGLALYGRTRPRGVLADAIVVVEQARPRLAPAPSARELVPLDEGTRLTVMEHHGSYARVARGGRTLGWLERRALGTY